MDPRLSLNFVSEQESVSLYGAEFFYAGGRRDTIRGTNGQSTFKWSAAVHALCVLLLNHAAGVSSKLEGGVGSLAASLDYAISKQPAWLLDLFGVDKEGNSLLRRLVARINPERKRPGPVTIMVREDALKPGNISVELDGVVVDVEGIPAVCARLNRRTRVNRSPDTQAVVDTERDGFLFPIFLRETLEMIRDSSVFRQKDLESSVASIDSNPLFRKLAGKGLGQLSDLIRVGSPSHRLGVLNYGMICPRALEEGFKVAVDATSMPCIAILKNLERRRSISVLLDYGYADTTEMLGYVEDGSFCRPIDAVVLSVPALANLLGRRKKAAFRPLMLFPKVSHRVVTSREQPGKHVSKRIALMSNIVGTSYFFLDSLFNIKWLAKNSTTVEHRDPDEVFGEMRVEHDLSAISFFPHYETNAALNGCQVLEPPGGALSNQAHVLLLREDLYANKSYSDYLLHALRDSWLNLIEEPGRNWEIVSSMLGDKEYRNVLNRFLGLQYSS